MTTHIAATLAVAAIAGAGAVAGGSASATAPGANGPIVFERFGGRSSASSQLFALAPDGSVRQLTHVKGGAFHPAWTPDASRVVFEVGELSQKHVYSRLYTVAADGSGVRPLTNGCKGKCADLMASYSPDGQRIAFERLYPPWVTRHFGKNRRSEITFASRIDVLVMKASGGKPQLVKRYGVDPQPWDGAPQWSPDGKTLVLALGSGKHKGSASAQGGALATLTVAGGAQRVITPWTLGAGPPSWSPDGKLIAFHSEGGHTSHIYVVAPDGKGLRDVLPPSRSGFGQHPAWSPDGTQIAFDFGAPGDGQRGIYAMNPDGSNVHMLVDTPQNELAPNWGPAGGAAP
jgi:Tol biopolymer transport system component